MESLVPFIIQIITGVIGGEAVGAAFRHAAMGQVAEFSAARSAVLAAAPSWAA